MVKRNSISQWQQQFKNGGSSSLNVYIYWSSVTSRTTKWRGGKTSGWDSGTLLRPNIGPTLFYIYRASGAS
jgi:hypothetical protein